MPSHFICQHCKLVIPIDWQVFAMHNSGACLNPSEEDKKMLPSEYLGKLLKQHTLGTVNANQFSEQSIAPITTKVSG